MRVSLWRARSPLYRSRLLLVNADIIAASVEICTIYALLHRSRLNSQSMTRFTENSDIDLISSTTFCLRLTFAQKK